MKKLVLMQSELEFLKENISKRIQFLNKKIKREYKNVFLLMKILVLLSLVMNFGAVFMTNMLVMKQNPAAVIVEANPVMARTHNLESATVQRGINLMFMLAIQSVIWAIFLFGFFYSMGHIYTRKQMYWAAFIVFFYFIVLGIDFFNDFGFFIGKLAYGG